MKYQDALEILSQSGLGALILSGEGRILLVNETGDCLLHGKGELTGKFLSELALPLCVEAQTPLYANIAFGEYLKRCPSPDISDLPAGTQFVVFRDATNDVRVDMLLNIVNQMKEAVILCDADSRILLQNDAHMKMESIETRDVWGENVAKVYHMRDKTQLNIPEVIRTRRPKLNHRQYYTTQYGKDMDVVSNNYPVMENGQVLGGFSIMEDWSTINDLHKQIVELREKLRSRNSSGKGKSENNLNARYHFDDIIHISAAMNRAVTRCKQVAQTDSSVMLYGETGTGKELFAQSIHNASRRADGPFLAINCAAIPENLLESLLFGTEKGAYTGAERRPGLFEQADGGTLLLDEINSMNISLQAKLLRVLQDGVVRRVGGASEIQVNVRVLSNTNIPPYQAIEENKLRRDLFYRLGVVNINIPPLRERKEDIPILAKTFVMQCNKKIVRNVRDVDQNALERFYAYEWPGNVRELQHAIEHAMNILPDDQCVITPEYLPEHIFHAYHPKPVSHTEKAVQTLQKTKTASLNHTIHGIEYSTICSVLRETGGNISESARILQMSRQNLQYRIKRYKIDMDRFRGKTENK
ncbi:MAG: sigma 54-interacting transcriptional regulator [Clostridia bacterium]|nr:sigma 54-interacting transcriptional regulator [Clostridia bacterium]